MKWIASIVIAATATAHAEPACVARADVQVAYGSVERGHDPCVMIATTDGSVVPFGWVEIGTRTKYTLPIAIDVTWRRLDSDGRSLEIELLGGSLLFREGSWGAYLNDDAGFAWLPFPALQLGVLSSVHVVQYPDRIELAVDGRALSPIPYVSPLHDGFIGFAAKSSSGVRARVELRRISVHGR